ncbi:hypothetical protein QOT17_014602 [Balamuthia mandrillaris]
MEAPSSADTSFPDTNAAAAAAQSRNGKQKLQRKEPKVTGDKVYTTSVVVLVPPEHWPPIQRIREKHIFPFLRCGPHVTLSYPFVPYDEIEEAARVLRNILKDFAPFQMELSRFGSFKQKKRNNTLFLCPETTPSNGLMELNRRIIQEYPYCDDVCKKTCPPKFHPHLSMGSFRTFEDLDYHQELYQRDWKTITFLVKELYIISRTETGNYEVRHTIPLGSDEEVTPTHFPESPLALEEQLKIAINGFPETVTVEEIKGWLTGDPLHLAEGQITAIEVRVNRFRDPVAHQKSSSAYNNRKKNKGQALIQVDSPSTKEEIISRFSSAASSPMLWLDALPLDARSLY